MTENFRDIKWYKSESIKNYPKQFFLCREIAKRGDKFVIVVDLSGVHFFGHVLIIITDVFFLMLYKYPHCCAKWSKNSTYGMVQKIGGS